VATLADRDKLLALALEIANVTFAASRHTGNSYSLLPNMARCSVSVLAAAMRSNTPCANDAGVCETRLWDAQEMSLLPHPGQASRVTSWISSSAKLF
jgi:hypothetical protein